MYEEFLNLKIVIIITQYLKPVIRDIDEMVIYCWMWIKVDIFCCFCLFVCLCSLYLFYTCILFSFIAQRVIHEEQESITLHEFTKCIVMGFVLSISSFLCRVTLIIVHRCILFLVFAHVFLFLYSFTISIITF